MVHYKGLYYAIGSRLTGWDANPNKYATAKSPERPLVGVQGHRPAGDQDLRIAIHDAAEGRRHEDDHRHLHGRHLEARTQWDSRYLWMPLEIGGGKLRLPEPKPFTLDVRTGEAVVKK